jgi:hypothetical protein
MLQILLWIVGGSVVYIWHYWRVNQVYWFRYWVYRTIVYASSLLVYTNYSSN